MAVIPLKGNRREKLGKGGKVSAKLHEELVRGELAALAALEREWIGEIVLVLGVAGVHDHDTLDRITSPRRHHLAADRGTADPAKQPLARRRLRPDAVVTSCPFHF